MGKRAKLGRTFGDKEEDSVKGELVRSLKQMLNSGIEQTMGLSWGFSFSSKKMRSVEQFTSRDTSNPTLL